MGARKYPPTRRKLLRAREDGDVARSATLTATVLLTIGISWVFVRGGQVLGVFFILDDIGRENRDFDASNMIIYLTKAWGFLTSLLAEFFSLLFIGGVITEAIQVGTYVSFKPLVFNLRRLNPFTGLERILGLSPPGSEMRLPKGVVVEGARIFAVSLASFGLFLFSLRHDLSTLLFCEVHSVSDVVSICFRSLGTGYLALLFFLWFISLLSVIRVRRERNDRLSLDEAEWRREFREQEGNPEMRAHRKQIYDELSDYDLVQSVRRAKVLLVGRE